MAILSELLDFSHHDCSRGSTVNKPFLIDLAKALGVTVPKSMKKDDVLAAAYAAATGEMTPALGEPGSILSPGTTVTNEALQSIIDGVLAKGLQVDLAPDSARSVRLLIEEAAEGEEPELDPEQFADDRCRAIRSLSVRSGQKAFRHKVLDAYKNRCAITGCSVQQALEAAHITPYKGTDSNASANGIALRADVHRLWDLGFIAVHEDTRLVLVSAQLVGTDYEVYAGKPIERPTKASQRPARLALKQQREYCGL